MIYNKYIFWINVGIMIYLGGAFFFYILIDHLPEDQVTTFSILANCAEILKNILFLIAVYVFIKFPMKDKETKEMSVPFLDFDTM